MSPVAAVGVRWTSRREPLSPCGVYGEGAVGARLARRVLGCDDDRLRRLVAVAAADALLVIGPFDALPWVDGVVYVGRVAAAPGLLVPTNLAPTVPVDLLERALLAAHPDLGTPVAVLADPPRLVPAGDARSIERDRLERWSRR